MSESVENLQKKNKLNPLLKYKKIQARENTQKSRQTPGPLSSPRRGLQNMGQTSEVINQAHKNQTKLFRIIKAEKKTVTKQDVKLEWYIRGISF